MEMCAVQIPFNKVFTSGKEQEYVADAINRGHLSGDGYYTKQCNTWLEDHISAPKALLTHSCTAALEMAAILADIQPGDEVIMPLLSLCFDGKPTRITRRGSCFRRYSPRHTKSG